MDFAHFGHRWSTGWDVAYIEAQNTPSRTSSPGSRGRKFYDLDRVDGGVFLTLHHRLVEPTVEFRMIDYGERVLPANDYPGHDRHAEAHPALPALARLWTAATISIPPA